jgi:nitrous oxidase accessory protein NosD
MTMHMKYVSFALGMLVSVCVIAHAGETTLTVGKPNTDCPNAEYTTIAAAVIAAAPGDIIEICPALYPEQLVISKPLTLRGVRDNVAGNEVNRVLLQPCVEILPGNGFGVLVDSDKPGPFYVAVENNSIHDFTKDGVQAINAGVTAKVEGNRIAGVGPSIAFQFGVFIANGAVGLINGNIITEGPCGSLSPANCLNARSEGVTLKSFGDGTVVSHNVITHAQSGIFINGGNDARISDNFISDIDSLDGIDIQAQLPASLPTAESTTTRSLTLLHLPTKAAASSNTLALALPETRSLVPPSTTPIVAWVSSRPIIPRRETTTTRYLLA